MGSLEFHRGIDQDARLAMENHPPNNDVESTQLEGAQQDAPMSIEESASVDQEHADDNSVRSEDAVVQELGVTPEEGNSTEEVDSAEVGGDNHSESENDSGTQSAETGGNSEPVTEKPKKKRRSRKKATAAEPKPSGQSVPEGLEKLWYVLKVQSNRERSIRDSIIRRIKMEGMEEFFGEIFIPTEKVVETKGGGRRVRENKLLPGYMMIEMVMTDESWHLVRSTSGVGDFTGAGGKPIPLAEDEVRRWTGMEVEEKKEEEKSPRPVVKFDVAVGDQVKVKEGAFAEFEGSVDHMDEATGKVKVIIEIFGRPTEVELEHWQVEKG